MFVYTDEGISSTNTKKREGFNQMVADALAGQIDLIVTKSVSRFARNTVDRLATVRKLKERGVEIFFEKENSWTLDSKGELLITIMSSLAQEESRSISENVIWGQRKRFADGRVSMPYKHFLGYEKGENGQPVVNEKEAILVKLIFRLFFGGENPCWHLPLYGCKRYPNTLRQRLFMQIFLGELLPMSATISTNGVNWRKKEKAKTCMERKGFRLTEWALLEYSQVSQQRKRRKRDDQWLNEQVQSFRECPLAGEAYPVRWVDALYEKVRYGGRIVSMAIKIVCGMKAQGRREVPALEPILEESMDNCQLLLEGLKARGMRTPLRSLCFHGFTTTLTFRYYHNRHLRPAPPAACNTG